MTSHFFSLLLPNGELSYHRTNCNWVGWISEDYSTAPDIIHTEVLWADIQIHYRISDGRKEKFTDSPHVREYGFRNPENFCWKIWNPGLWNPGYRFRNPESSGFDWQIRNPVPESGIYGMESRIQDCRGFSYIGRADSYLYNIIGDELLLNFDAKSQR